MKKIHQTSALKAGSSCHSLFLWVEVRFFDAEKKSIHPRSGITGCG